MLIISHSVYIRHQLFAKFMFSEAHKDPRDRMKHTGHLGTILSSHSINMKKIMRELGMAKDTKTKKFKWNGYCNINIPEAIIGDAEKYIADDKNVFASFNQMLIQDYRISINFDAEQESFKATATCFDSESPNHGFAMSAYADDWYTALAALLFKHFEVSDENWTDYQQAKKRSFG